MKIVVLDGYTLNPGDLSWDKLLALGDVSIYDRTPSGKIIERSKDAEILITNKPSTSKKLYNHTSYCMGNKGSKDQINGYFNFQPVRVLRQ